MSHISKRLYKKNRILFILLGNQDKASSRVRGFWIAEALEQLGMEYRIVYGQSRMALLKCLVKIPWADVVNFQKDCSKWHIRLLRIVNFLGKKTLYDIDDAPSRINNPVTLRNARKMMTKASVVVAGSQRLLDYATEYQSNSFLLPTSIKLEHYVPVTKAGYQEMVCLGWIGNGAHYGNDLVKILREPLKEIGSRQRVRFKIVGACGNKRLYDAFSEIPGVEIVFIDQIRWSDPGDVQSHLAAFDIGLYPVLDTEFNHYKCGFKALEYMAMKIPVIASPVGANSYVVENGKDGYHAKDTKEWIGALHKLITNPAARKKFGQAGRHKVETQYSVVKFAQTLTEIMFKLKN